MEQCNSYWATRESRPMRVNYLTMFTVVNRFMGHYIFPTFSGNNRKSFGHVLLGACVVDSVLDTLKIDPNQHDPSEYHVFCPDDHINQKKKENPL